MNQQIELNKDRLVSKNKFYELYDLGHSAYAKYKDGTVIKIDRRDLYSAKRFTYKMR